jgi:hypothetical protein
MVIHFLQATEPVILRSLQDPVVIAEYQLRQAQRAGRHVDLSALQDPARCEKVIQRQIFRPEAGTDEQFDVTFCPDFRLASTVRVNDHAFFCSQPPNTSAHIRTRTTLQGTRSNRSLGQLLAQFFCYYGVQLKFMVDIVSIKDGCTLRKENHPSNPARWRFSIEDPFEIRDLGGVIGKRPVSNSVALVGWLVRLVMCDCCPPLFVLFQAFYKMQNEFLRAAALMCGDHLDARGALSAARSSRR